MKSNQLQTEFADDIFAHTKMSFWDHIEELRTHMWRAILGFLVCLCVGLAVGKPVTEFIARPVERELMNFYNRRIERTAREKGTDPHLKVLNKPRDVRFALSREQLQELATATGIKGEVPPRETPFELTVTIKPLDWAIETGIANLQVSRPPALSTLSATEAFIVYFKVSIYCGIVLASPWIFYQLWSFVAAGLHTHEKRLVNVYLPVSLGLFLSGVALAQFVVIPQALEYLLSFNEWMNVEPTLRLNEWLSFAIMTPLVFGVAFQLPLVMVALSRLGIFDAAAYRKHRRYAMFLMAILAVILAPSPDWYNMLALTVPLWFLYELGIVLCSWSPRPEIEVDVPESEEMIEV